MGVIERVEAEFEEPFLVVVQGFAAMGYGLTATAGAIGCRRETLYRILRKLGACVPWVSRHTLSSQTQKGRAPACAGSNRRAIAHPVTGQVDSVAGWAKRMGICEQAMYRRLARWRLVDALSLVGPRYGMRGGTEPMNPGLLDVARKRFKARGRSGAT